MGRKVALVIALVAALVIALPSLASAAWTHKGKGELKSNATVTLTGELTLSTSAGNVSCPTELGATLTASSSAGHVNSFTVSKPAECDLSGSLGTICGTHGLTKVEKTGTWALTADESDITLSGIDVDYVLAGCLIPSFRVKGNSTITLDKTTAIGKATLGGSQTLYNAVGEESGSGELKGTLTVSPAGTYGVKTAATVETVWLDGGSHLSEDGKLTLTGNFSFSGSGGSVSCPATVKLQLESSTVEEEEPEGEVESFTVSKPAECDLGGTYNSSCGSTTNRVTKVEQTGTATLAATEEDIKVSNLVLDYEFEKCSFVSLRVEGNPTLTPSNPESISEATFSAGSLEVFNSKGETLNTATAGGSTTASPSGTFALISDAEETEETAETEEHETLTEHEHQTLTEEEHETFTTGGGGSGLTLQDEWFTNSGEETVEGEQTFGGSGEISTEALGGAFKTGPIALHLHGFAFNAGGIAQGFFDEATFTGEVPTNLPGCSAPTVTNNASPENPWTISTSTADPEFSIGNMTFTMHYAAGCTKYGVPSTISTAGTLTGTIENGEEGFCVLFNKSGDLQNEATSGAVNWTGEICF